MLQCITLCVGKSQITKYCTVVAVTYLDKSDGLHLFDRDEREEDCCEDPEHSLAGTKVRVKYGKGKTQKIYEANIKNTETDDGEVLYLVHYYGWNVR